jgi:hypothetical protein
MWGKKIIKKALVPGAVDFIVEPVNLPGIPGKVKKLSYAGTSKQ